MEKNASSHKDLPNIRHLKTHLYSLAFKSVRPFVISYSRNKEKTFLKILSCCLFLIYNLIILHVQHFGQQPLLYVLHKYISTFSTQAVIKSSFILLSFCYFKVRGVKILFLSLMLYTLLSLPVTLCLQFTFL